MDKVIDTLSNYISTCATCESRLRGECGFVDKSLTQRVVGEEAYFMMDDEERNAYGTRLSHLPCEFQFSLPLLLKKLKEGVEEAEIHYTADWLLWFFTKLHEIERQTHHYGDKFEECFNSSVNEAILNIIARVDLYFLRNKIDIANFLAITGFHYDIESVLYELSPRGIVDLYIKMAKPIDLDSLVDAGNSDVVSNKIGGDNAVTTQDSDDVEDSPAEEIPPLVEGGELVDIPDSGIEEIDALSKYYDMDEAFEEYYFADYQKRFKEKCRKVAADKSTSTEEKKVWIRRAVNTLDTLYIYDFEKHAATRRCAAGLLATMECEFLQMAEPICMRKVCIELDSDHIYRDRLLKEQHTEEEYEHHFNGYWWTIIHGIGGNLGFYEKKACSTCVLKDCPYRNHFTKNEVEYFPEGNDGEARNSNLVLLNQMSAVNHFLTIYGDDYVRNYVWSIIAQIGIDPDCSIRAFDSSIPALKQKLTNSYNGFILPEYNRWDELSNEISASIKAKKKDALELDEYVYSLLGPLKRLSEHIYPSKDDWMNRRGAEALRLFATARRLDQDEFVSGWNAIVSHHDEMPKAKEFSLEGLPEVITKSLRFVADGFISSEIKGDSDILETLLDILNRYADIIEGALLKNGIANDIWHYQQTSGVVICEEVRVYSIASYMGWTNGQTETYIEKFRHHLNMPSKKEAGNNTFDIIEISHSDTGVANGGGSVPSHSVNQNSSAGSSHKGDNDSIAISDALRPFLDALREEEYLDDNYRWISNKKGKTYYAGWAASIINYHVQDVSYKMIESLFGMSGLTDAASKCRTQGKKTKIAEIEAVFKKHGLLE